MNWIKSATEGDKSSEQAVLAFDIGGTRIKAGLVRGATVSSLTVVPTASSPGNRDILASVVSLGRHLMAGQAITGIGLCVKGVVDPAQGTLLDVNEVLADWIGEPLAAVIGSALGCRTCMENDARMYALGEMIHGAGRGSESMVCLTLGTGVGCGVALGGRILRGPHGTRGIMGGQVTVQINGKHCTCGNIGCLETIIGTAGVIQSAEAALTTDRPSTLRDVALDPQHIFAAAAAGDEVANDVVRGFITSLGAGVVTMIHAYDPDVVVLGGGMALASAQILSPVQAYVDEHAWTVPRGRVQVVPAVLGDTAALIGVAELSRGTDALW